MISPTATTIEGLICLHSGQVQRLDASVEFVYEKSRLILFIPIYIQQDATLHSLLYLETALHVSGGTSTHHQERMQLYLQHLVFVTPLLLPAAIVEEMELV